MARLRLRLAALLVVAPALLAACGKDDSPPKDNPDGSNDTTACLDRPGALPRPPQGRLPCDLIPPGLSLR